MKKSLVVLFVSVLCMLFATLDIYASDDVDNYKYLPKVITTDDGYKMMFDSELARIARRMSEDSYGIAINSNPQDIATTYKEEGFVDIQQSHLYNDIYIGVFSNNFLVGVKTFEVDGSQKHILAIAYRGTQVKDVFDFADLFTDANILGLNGFHSGFYAAALKSFDTLYDMEFPSLKNEDGSNMRFSDYLKHISDGDSDYSMLVTGHSLGGAVANIFAGDIMSRFSQKNVMCYTFASPIVCSPTVAKGYDAYNIFNIINTVDFVPDVGYNLFLGVRLGTDLKVSVSGSEEGAHNLKVTYEKATNQVINKIDSLYPNIHRIRLATLTNGEEFIEDEIHIHTDCSLDKNRFSGNLGNSDLFIYGNVDINTDVNVNGDLYSEKTIKLGSATVNVNGNVNHNRYILYVGNGKLNVEGNYNQQYGASVYVGDGDLKIKGDYDCDAGTLNIERGRLEIGGNLNIHYSSALYGYFTMKEESAYVLIGGDFIFNVYIENKGSITAGTIELKGDFINTKGDVKMDGTNKIILTGDKPQEIWVDDSDSNLNILESTNSSVDFLNNVKVNKIEGNSVFNKLNVTGTEFLDDISVMIYSDFTCCSIKLNSAKVNVNGNVNHNRGILYVGNGKLNVEGNYNQQYGASVYVGDGDLKIKGDYDCDAGTLNIERGRLEIGGNLNIHYSSALYGYFTMKEESAYVLIGGDFIFNVYIENKGSITAGTIELKGDFINTKGDVKMDGTNKIILTGDKPQEIWVDDSDSNLNILESTNSSVDFLNNVKVNKIEGNSVFNKLNVTGTEFLDDISVMIYSDFTCCSIKLNSAKVNVNGNVNHNRGILYVGNGKLNVEGNYNQQYGASVYVGDGDLKIKGDYDCDAGTLNIERGRLEIGGNLNIHYSSALYGYFTMKEESAYVLIGGDFIFNVYIENKGSITAGTIELKGDFINTKGDVKMDGINKFILSGDIVQKISIASSSSYFNALIMLNTNVEVNSKYSKYYKYLFSEVPYILKIQTNTPKGMIAKILDSTNQNLVSDQINSLGELNKSGYRFNGWFLDDEYTIPLNAENDIITSDITLYAKWDELMQIESVDHSTENNTLSVRAQLEEELQNNGGIIIIAVYSGKEMIASYSDNVKETVSHTFTDIPYKDDSGYTVKVFLWSDFNELTPLYNAVSKTTK